MTSGKLRFSSEINLVESHQIDDLIGKVNKKVCASINHVMHLGKLGRLMITNTLLLIKSGTASISDSQQTVDLSRVI